MKLERIIHTLITLLLAVFVYFIFDSFHERLVVVGDSAPDSNGKRRVCKGEQRRIWWKI